MQTEWMLDEKKHNKGNKSGRHSVIILPVTNSNPEATTTTVAYCI